MIVQLVERVGPPYKGIAAMLGDVRLAIGTGAVCCQAARALLAMGHSGPVEFRRGDTLCLSGLIEDFAKLTVLEGHGRPRWGEYVPFNRAAVACGGPADAI